MPLHPCQTCGACCAAYRVAFHWSEAAPELGGVTPPELTVPLDPHRLAIAGTLAEPIRCVGLRGAVGVATRCAVYAARPSPCRQLAASWEHAMPSPQCDRARARHGLPPLAPADWRRDRAPMPETA
jgi:Fe-S-cluster containining protein